MLVGLFPATALPVRAEGGDTLTISDAAGWNQFCDLLEQGETFAGKTVQLAADVGTADTPVTRMAGVIGDNAVPFCGVFDGGGHTLYFSNTSVNDNYIAPFRYVSGSYDGHAAVHHLNVNTTISSAGYRHLCGLIALTKGYVDVVSCNAEIDISCAASADNSDLYPAGIVSQVSSDGNGTVTVTDCTVTGTITSGGKYAASLVGIVQGRATIQSSVGSVVIRSTVNGDGTHGGLVAVTATNSTTGIYGCVFNGKLLTVGQNDTGNCGGILGWKNATVYITDCLYAPAALADGEREVVAGSGDHPSGTFYRGNAPTLTNCYYIRPLGTPQATQGYAVTEGDYVSVDYGTMTSFYSLPDITVYQNGMFYHGKLYCGEGTSLPLSYAPRADYTFTGFQVNGAPLNGSTLTMPAEDVTVTATYAANEYNITVNYETQHGAVYVHVNGVSGTTAHVGDTVTLTVTPDAGYALDALTVTDANGDPVPVTNNSFTMPASDVTVTVTFCLGNYAILIDQDIRNGTVSASVNNEPATTAKMGDLVTLTAVPDPGWELDSYQVRDAGEHPVPVQDDHFTMPGVAVIVNATFRPLDLAITIDSQIQHGSVSASVNDQPAATAHVGDRVTLTVTPDTGWSLASVAVVDANGNVVSLTGSGTDSWTFTMPASDVSVTAAFAAVDYSIVIAAMTNGSVAASVNNAPATAAHYGDLVTLTAAPDQGFVLVENGLIVLADDFFSPELLPVANNQFTMPKRSVIVAAAFLPAAKSVRYIDETGTERTVMAYPLTEGVTYLPGGWYVAEGEINLLEPLTFVDDARLILADGCRMTVSSDSAVLAQGDLTFYGQSWQTGSFAAKAPQSSPFAFTPWGGVTVDGNLSVCGGNVISATDGERCFWVGDSLTVLRGTLEAVGNVGGPAKNGILCDSLFVYGGAVRAEGREYGLKTYVSCRISGGNVSFSGGYGGILDQGAGIELGWTEPTDSIYASSYSGSVTVAEDTTFVNDDDPPMMISEGPVEDLSLIDGFTLLPPGGSFVIHVLKTGTGTVLCPATAFQGEIVNLTVIPTGSSALSALSLKDSAGNELTLSDDGNNSWSFTMPADHVTLEIRFEELYHVYIDSGIPHGTVTADKTWAAAGEPVTLTCTPDAGYVLVENSVVLTDASYNYVTVYDDQFLMPANNLSVTVAFLKAPKSVSYVDETGRTKTAMAYPLEEDVTLLPGGWYVAEGTLNFGEFSFYGTTPANLILADGCQMTAEPAWAVYCGEELRIYGQSGQTGTLSIHGGDTSFYTYADLYICGGRLELSGNSYGLRCDNTIWIYGGTVEATATGSSGSGIMGYRVCIIGGTVNASGTAGIGAYQNIEFYGGNVSAVGSDGGIWPGEETLLSWTDPTDSIYASSYRNTVTVVNGMSFVTDDDPPVTIPAGPVDDLSVINGRTLTPFGPIETPDLHIYSSISVGTDMVITFSARKSDLTNYEKFWIEVVKHEPDGDVVYRYGEDQAEPLSDLNPNGTVATTWKARFTHIYAKEMGLDVDARLCAQDADGQVYVSPVRSANIRDYLGERLTATNNKIQQRVLAADMLNYGAAAQLFTGFETDHLVNQELTAAQLAKLHQYETTALPAVNKTNTNYRPAGASNILFTSVTLGNEVLLNLTIRLPEGTEGVQVLVKDHETGTVVTTLDTAFLGSTFNAAFSGIGADKMRTEYDLVTLVNGVETGNTRTWSVEAYVGEIRAENKPLKVAMANALLTYGDSAAAYFAAQ